MTKFTIDKTKQHPPQANATSSVHPSVLGSNAEKQQRPENARNKDLPVAVVKHPTYCGGGWVWGGVGVVRSAKKKVLLGFPLCMNSLSQSFPRLGLNKWRISLPKQQTPNQTWIRKTEKREEERGQGKWWGVRNDGKTIHKQ